MSYRDWQRQHPDWPKRLADLEGRKVRLTNRVETRGGALFEAGEVLTVYGIYRGRLHLRSERKDEKGHTLEVRMLSRACVELDAAVAGSVDEELRHVPRGSRRKRDVSAS